MFGYIVPAQDELYVRDWKKYRAVYCSVCKTGGKYVSKFTRFFLNYDFVFLALVRAALTKEDTQTEMSRCPYSFKKREMLVSKEAVTYTAAAFGILSYLKLKDDIADSRGFKKLSKQLVRPVFSRMKRKSAKLYPELCTQLENAYDEFAENEESSKGSLDRAADGFAKLTAITACCNIEGSTKEVARECGYHLGRYIYIIDAFDDCEEDFEKGEYNCLNEHFGNPENVKAQSEEIKRTLSDSMRAFARAYALADGNECDNLIYNIVGPGCLVAFERVLSKKNGETGKKHKKKNNR